MNREKGQAQEGMLKCAGEQIILCRRIGALVASGKSDKAADMLLKLPTIKQAREALERIELDCKEKITENLNLLHLKIEGILES